MPYDANHKSTGKHSETVTGGTTAFINLDHTLTFTEIKVTATSDTDTAGQTITLTIKDGVEDTQSMSYNLSTTQIDEAVRFTGAICKLDIDVTSDDTVTFEVTTFQSNAGTTSQAVARGAPIVHVYPANVSVERNVFPDIINNYTYGRVWLTDAGDNPRTIWSFADDDISPRHDTKLFPSTPNQIWVASDDPTDVGTTWTVNGIDANGDFWGDSVTLDATDATIPVLLGTGIDINFTFLSGDNQTHDGNIYFVIENAFTNGIPDNPENVICHVPAGYACSPQNVLRVPRGKEFILNNIILSLSRSGGAAGSAVIKCWVRVGYNGSFTVAREWHIQTGTAVLPTNHMRLPEGSIFELRIDDVSSVDTNVTSEVHYTEVLLGK